MSNYKTTSLLYGIKLTAEEGELLGMPYDNESWEPIINGVPGERLRLLFDGSAIKEGFYLGWELAATDEDESVVQKIELPDIEDVYKDLYQLEIQIPFELINNRVELWLLDTYY